MKAKAKKVSQRRQRNRSRLGKEMARISELTDTALARFRQSQLRRSPRSPDPPNVTFEAWLETGGQAGVLIQKLLRMGITNFAVHVKTMRPPVGAWMPIEVQGGVVDDVHD